MKTATDVAAIREEIAFQRATIRELAARPSCDILGGGAKDREATKRWARIAELEAELEAMA